ncbi:hypothetical protein AAE478_009744 [Parahypoxylon ruwenzoriense]
MADTGPKWRPLPEFSGLPALMISPRFASSSYTIHVTDLANVWVESLDRKGILLRSLQENTSIDLSDGDPDQWIVFLSKLDAALDSTSPDHHSTSLSLSALQPDKTTESGLVLHVTCVLPRPLKPLRWPIYLAKCPPVSLASELVLPLIQAHYTRTLEMEDLVARLKEKDAVISKLVDKLSAMNTGLEHVFNSLSGKRRPSKEVAEEKVKGLAVFHESDWKSGVNTDRDLPRDVSSLISKVFENSGLRSAADQRIDASSQLNDWWTRLGPNLNTAIKPRQETPRKPKQASPQNTGTVGGGDDDDFQVLTSPPHLRSHGRKKGHSRAADDTAEEDDSPVEIPDSFPSSLQEKSRFKIGALGGIKEANKDNSPSQSSRTVPVDDDETASESDKEPVRPNPRLGTIGKFKGSPSPSALTTSEPPRPVDDDDETASGSDVEDAPLKAQSPSQPTVRQRKVGLGRIGGKSRVTPEPHKELNARTVTVGSPKATSPLNPPGRKIGDIGGTSGADIKRQRLESPVKAVEPETEEQKAERRRAEIAKALERKTAAPTKKKRKF